MTRRRQLSTTLVVTALAVPLSLVLPATPVGAAPSLCGPPADTVAPQVTSVSLSTDAVDLNSGSRDITITVHAIDTAANATPSGVKQVEAYFSGPRFGVGSALKLSSGTATDGDWAGTVTVAKTAHPGTLNLQYVDLSDAARNSQQYGRDRQGPSSPSDVRLQSGWDTSVAITGTPLTITADKPGKLTSFTFAPRVVDTTATARKVHIFATFTKPYPKRVPVYFQRVSGHGRGVAGKQEFRQTSPGHWTGYLKVGRWLGSTTDRPRLYAEYGSHIRPSFHAYSTSDLKKVGAPTRLKVVSGVDKHRPALTSLTISPASVDTTGGPQVVTVTANATDALSGVKNIRVNFSIGTAEVSEGAAAVPTAGYYPYHGLGFEQEGFHAVKLVRLGGEWTGTTTFRRCESIGTWHVEASVQDQADNTMTYSPKKLLAAGLPATLPVSSTPGDIQAPYQRGATASSQYKQITIDFTEGVRNVDHSTLQVYPTEPASTRFTAPDPISDMTCSNGTATVDCAGSGGLVTSVTMDLATLDVGAEYQVFANQNAVTPQLTDGVGNPADWNYELTDVTGS